LSFFQVFFAQKSLLNLRLIPERIKIKMEATIIDLFNRPCLLAQVLFEWDGK
jgi:hypothetical protein